MTEERPLAADTPIAIERAQRAIWQHMTPSQKFATFLARQRTTNALAEAGIRLRHPQADAREVFLRRVARSLDRATMLRVYGWESADPA